MTPAEQASFWQQIRKVLYAIEDSVLVSLLLSMILMASGQILFRLFFGTTFVWADAMVRVLVLWVGLFGAMVASRKGNHICIDLATRYLGSHSARYAKLLVDLFTAAVCLIVVYHSAILVNIEYTDSTLAFASVPTWVCMTIMPFSFFVMSIRYFILAFSFQSEHGDK
jgi:TRAP-type C4-dicarboxylate transport system permease small subunit